MPFARRVHRGRPVQCSMQRRSTTDMRRCKARLVGAMALVSFALVISATPAAAQTTAPPTSLGQVVDNARLWVMGILAGVATLFFVMGGARYVMAGGDPSEVERAKQTLKSALAGYALAVLAPVILSVLRSIVGG